MREKFPLWVLVGFCLCIPSILQVSVCRADIAAQLEQAEAYYKSKDYARARQIFEGVMLDNAADPCAVWAQAGIAKSCVALGDETVAEAATGKLIADFSGHNYIARAVHKVACEYYDFKNPQKADELKRYIIKHWPEDDCAMWSQMDLATTCIRFEDEAGAIAALEKLITDYSDNKGLPQALYAIGGHYRSFNKFAQAGAIFQYVAQNYPDSEFADAARFDLKATNARMGIESGDFAAAKAETDDLVNDFSANPEFANVLCRIAHRYEELRKFDKAREIYRKVSEKLPGTEWAIKASLRGQMIDVVSLIDSGRYEAVDTEISRLVLQFGDHPDLPWVLSRLVGEQYYRKGLALEKRGEIQEGHVYLRKAVGVWEIVMNGLLSGGAAPEACHWGGDCYIRLAEYEDAIRCYERVVDSYPKYHMRWHVMYMAGRTYQDMSKAGLIPKQEADLRTRVVFQELIVTYPNCPAAQAAQSWMSK